MALLLRPDVDPQGKAPKKSGYYFYVLEPAALKNAENLITKKIHFCFYSARRLKICRLFIFARSGHQRKDAFQKNRKQTTANKKI